MKPSNPDKIFGPQLASLFQKYCEMVFQESKASSIKVTAEFLFTKGRGDLKMKTFTTPDALTERMLDPEVPLPRGSRLQHEASLKLRSQVRHLTQNLGGK